MTYDPQTRLNLFFDIDKRYVQGALVEVITIPNQVFQIYGYKILGRNIIYMLTGNGNEVQAYEFELQPYIPYDKEQQDFERITRNE